MSVMESEMHKKAEAWLTAHAQEIIDLTVGVCEVPAPPFGEQDRARHVCELFANLGEAEVDSCGNAICIYQEPQPGQSALVVSAHLDTVFPPGTDVRVKPGTGCKAGRLHAPGIGDNSVCVAIMVAVMKALRAQGYCPPCGLAFAANVGEEGLGDLRGMKHLFDAGLASRWPLGAALVYDGDLGFLCNQGIISRRLEIVYTGPGGHSWGDYGKPSALHAAGRAVATIDAITVPTNPRTTFNVGVIEGGVSINAIAAHTRLLVDMRSEDSAALSQLEQQVRSAAQAALAGHTELAVNISVVGDRPGGLLAPEHPYLQAMAATLAAKNLEQRWTSASTDANVPLSRGIPAVTVGLTVGGRAHTLEEYVEESSILPGAHHALVMLLTAVAYVNGVS